MIILIIVVIISFIALLTALYFDIEDDTIFGISLLLICAIIAMSIGIGRMSKQKEIEETMVQHEIIKYKTNKKEEIKTILVDSSDFNKQLYNKVILESEKLK